MRCRRTYVLNNLKKFYTLKFNKMIKRSGSKKINLTVFISQKRVPTAIRKTPLGYNSKEREKRKERQKKGDRKRKRKKENDKNSTL